jgi:hypothetical protein
MNNIAIQLKSTSTKFNFNSFQLNNWIKIQLNTYGMQIHKENIQNLLVNMFLEKKNF